MDKPDLSLYLVTDRGLAGGRSLEWIVGQAVRGGVTAVQLREKECSTLEFVRQALRLREILIGTGVPLIINDRLDVALAARADGLHIGQSDMPYSMARRILGRDKIIGLSVETPGQAREAELLDVDYIAISPVFSTGTKTDTSVPFGPDGVARVMSLTRHRTVAIGGINLSNAGEVIRAGAHGISVVSAIMSAHDPEAAARELKAVVLKALELQGRGMN